MDRDYTYAQAGISRSPGANVASNQSLETVIRNMTGALHSLSNEVTEMSDRMHGSSPIGALSAGGGQKKEPPAWADDLRQEAANAVDRGETALRELSRIRETLGL